MKWIIGFLAILAALVAIVYIDIHTDGYTPTFITDTITIPGDPIPYAVRVEVPVPHDSFIVVNDTFYRNVDTAEILRKYFTMYFYSDTIRDSSFIAILNESITRNTIVDRQLFVQNLRAKQVIKNTTIPLTSTKWFISAGTTIGDKTGFMLGGMYLNGKNAYGLGYDIINNNIQLSFNYKIK